VEGSGGSRADLEVDQATSKPMLSQARITECDEDHILFSLPNFSQSCPKTIIELYLQKPTYHAK